MKRELTDQQLEELGKKVSIMHQDAILVWKMAMAAMPIRSKQYREVCSMGRKIQDAYFSLRNEAEARNWQVDRREDVFSARKENGITLAELEFDEIDRYWHFQFRWKDKENICTSILDKIGRLL